MATKTFKKDFIISSDKAINSLKNILKSPKKVYKVNNNLINKEKEKEDAEKFMKMTNKYLR